MDVLRYRLKTTSPGALSVAAGVSRAQIIKVCRAGIQMDYTDLVDLPTSNRSWSWIPAGVGRIVFRSDTPFEVGEKIFIIYKIST